MCKRHVFHIDLNHAIFLYRLPMCSEYNLWWKAEVCVSSYQHMISAVSKTYATYHSICMCVHMFLFHLCYLRALGPAPLANVWLRWMQKTPYENTIVEERKGDTSEIWIVFLLSCQFYVCICVCVHMSLSHIYLDSLSGQTFLRLHLAALHKAVQNRESNLLLSLEIQLRIPIFLSPYFNFFHCHMCTYKLISLITHRTIRMLVNIDFGGYDEANLRHFLFMEQMHWQFISYSCWLPSGIHIYKLERYIGCLPIPYACLSYSPHNHNRIPIYALSSSQHAFEEENCNYSQFSQGKKGPGGLELVAPCLKKFILALSNPKVTLVCWTCYLLCQGV